MSALQRQQSRENTIRQVVSWIRFEYAEGRADATFSHYALALADDIERDLLRAMSPQRTQDSAPSEDKSLGAPTHKETPS